MFVLLTLPWLLHATRNQFHCLTTTNTNKTNTLMSKKPPKLFGHLPTRMTLVHTISNATIHRQRCILPLGTIREEQVCRTFLLPNSQQNHTSTPVSHRLINHTNGCNIGIRGRINRHLQQPQNWPPHHQHSAQIKSQTGPHQHHHRQFSHQGPINRHHETQKIKITPHAIFLHTRSPRPKNLPTSLAPITTKPCWLLHQTSPHPSSPQYPFTIHHGHPH